MFVPFERGWFSASLLVFSDLVPFVSNTRATKNLTSPWRTMSLAVASTEFNARIANPLEVKARPKKALSRDSPTVLQLWFFQEWLFQECAENTYTKSCDQCSAHHACIDEQKSCLPEEIQSMSMNHHQCLMNDSITWGVDLSIGIHCNFCHGPVGAGNYATKMLKCTILQLL